jgi:5'-nucleotidase (lipoprotein e(P4) family)
MKSYLIIILSVLLLASCKEKATGDQVFTENQDHLILAVLWYQSSAELKALYFQGYNIAKQSLAEKLRKPGKGKPKAVILDIDETVLDNSPVETIQITENLPFSDSLWLAWVKKSSAEPLPGALDFIKFAESSGVEVFYLSNRKSKEEFTPTLKNLALKGFPFADSLHLILKTDISSKEIRRKAIAEKFDILMLIGDNLADFDEIFDNRGDDLGFAAVKRNEAKFGTDFIMLPNPMYGPWINAALKDQQDTTFRVRLLRSLR